MKKALFLTLCLTHFIAVQLICDFVNVRIFGKNYQSISWKTVNIILALLKLISKIVVELTRMNVSYAALK